MPFSYPQFERSRLVWWNCKEIEPLPCKDLTTKSKACFRHLSRSSTNCNWKSRLLLLLKGKKSQYFWLINEQESGVLSSWSQFCHALEAVKPWGSQPCRREGGWHKQHLASVLLTAWGSCGTWITSSVQHTGHPSPPTDTHKSEHSSGKGGNCMQMSELNCNLAMKNTIILMIKPNQFYLKEKGCFSYLKYPLIHCYHWLYFFLVLAQLVSNREIISN